MKHETTCELVEANRRKKAFFFCLCVGPFSPFSTRPRGAPTTTVKLSTLVVGGSFLVEAGGVGEGWRLI